MEDRERRVRSGGAVAWVAACGLIASSAALGAIATWWGGSWLTGLLQTLVVACGLAGAAAMWRRTGPRPLVGVVVVAFLARVVLVPWPPFQSNDLYRYLWDGQVLARGLDPYVVVPSSPVLEALRGSDWIYPHIDWRDVPTLYPPLDLGLYALGAFFGELAHRSVVPLKLILLAGDALTIALIARSLRARGLPAGRLALYAWNPLAIVEFGLNGHEECIAIACIVAAVVALEAKRPLTAGIGFAGAVLSKLYPAAFVAALVAHRASRPAAFVCATLVIVAYVPFVVWNPDVLGFLHAFAFGYHFNDSLHRLVGTLGAAALFAGALVVAALERRRGTSAIAVVLGLEVAYLLLSPSVYPWYIATFPALLPLLGNAFSGAMRPLGVALIAWTAFAPLAYLAPWATPTGSPLDVAAHIVEYAPLAIAALVYALRDWRRVAAALGIAAISGCGTRAAAIASAAAQTSTVLRTVDARSTARGANLYRVNCAVCHTPTATSFVGPSLAHVAARRSRASLRTHIATSVPGGATFTPATIDALVNYLTAVNERSPKT